MSLDSGITFVVDLACEVLVFWYVHAWNAFAVANSGLRVGLAGALVTILGPFRASPESCQLTELYCIDEFIGAYSLVLKDSFIATQREEVQQFASVGTGVLLTSPLVSNVYCISYLKRPSQA